MSESLKYQYYPEFDYPIFIEFEDSEWGKDLDEMIRLFGFKKLSKDHQLKKEKNLTLLKVKRASPIVSKHIDQGAYQGDLYGEESLIPMRHYRVYRYLGVAMMTMSRIDNSWEMGIKAIEITALRKVFTRFLSHALERLGVVGFWGVPIDEGFVVMKPDKGQ